MCAIARCSARGAQGGHARVHGRHHYVGPIGEWPVRILGGLLLLSATNTAVNG
jgi:hypothetical protein